MLIGLNANLLAIVSHSFFLFFLFLEPFYIVIKWLISEFMRNFGTAQKAAKKLTRDFYCILWLIVIIY